MGFNFCWQEEAIRLCLWAKCKDSYVFLMTELWNICTICPFDYWLVSFLICVNYSVGIFISCLMFLCLKCLLTMDETQYCVYAVGLWFICYTSQSFKCSWFSVCFGLMNVFPLVFKLFNQNPRKTLFYLIVFIEIMLACSLIVWEQFMALTHYSYIGNMNSVSE